MPSLAEKYAPKRFEEVLGQSKLIRQLERLAVQGFGGKAYWLSGSSGTGKTTIAHLIATAVADPLNIEEVGARQLTMATIADYERVSRLYGMGAKTGRAFIINEAHGLRKDILERLLVVIDSGAIPSHVAWIFTTTRDGQDSLFEDYDDAGPLLSRCLPLVLTNQGLASAFAKRTQEIARVEGLDGQEMPAYLRLAKELRNNFRAMLSALEAGAMLQL